MQLHKIMLTGLAAFGLAFFVTTFADTTAPVVDATTGNQAMPAGDSSSSIQTTAQTTQAQTHLANVQFVNTDNNNTSNLPAPADNSANNVNPQQLAQQVNNLVKMNLPQQVNDLQQQIQQLQGQLQIQQHDIKLLNTQQRSFYQDLNQRISQMSTLNANSNGHNSTIQNTSRKTATPAKKTMRQSNAKLTESSAYENAFELIAKKQYDKAAKALTQYLNNYPKGRFVSNAYYWLGEIYLLQNKNKQAIKEFQTVINNYSHSPKVSDAKLKLAIVHLHQGNTAQARDELNQVKKQYPNTTAAQLATIQLQQMDSDVSMNGSNS